MVRTKQCTQAQYALYQALQASSPAYQAITRTANLFYANGAHFSSKHVARQHSAACKRWSQEKRGAGFVISRTGCGVRVVTKGDAAHYWG